MERSIMLRRLSRLAIGSVTALGMVVGTPAQAVEQAVVTFHPTVSDFAFISATTPTQADCAAVHRTCFTPQAIQSAYNVGPLYKQGYNGKGVTIAIVDSYGNDNMAHDLHVFDQAFGLQPMCGEEGVTCTSGMPTFKTLAVQGSPATKAPPTTANNPGQENKAAWALEVALDVETSHAIAPMANILLVTTPTAETLGVQGFPDMMKAEQYVVDNHLASVISQSFASAEDAFGSAQSLLNLRHAYISAAANGVTVLGSSGDGGTANGSKQPVGQGGSVIPYPTVEWPASDPLVTGVGGTYLCTNPTASTYQPRTAYHVPGLASKCGSSADTEIGWVGSGGGFSHVFSRPSYQDALPSGSTPIGSMRGVPDIALQASSRTGALVYLSLPPDGTSSNIHQTGWYDIGGTSLSCPQWAGLVAIADQIAGHGLGLINPKLYRLALTNYSNDFYDITSGNNQTDPTIAGYSATKGWDAVTGLGTPNAANLVWDLAH